jgi:hypothetical protein
MSQARRAKLHAVLRSHFYPDDPATAILLSSTGPPSISVVSPASNIIWRVADLLGVTTRQRVELRQ